jgi:hypothetical protein
MPNFRLERDRQSRPLSAAFDGHDKVDVRPSQARPR